ncbi:Burs [Cordylochernes scorpioides]|uniref:Burs n=1 Tax=Cordylochernes scorpioides TaxID=51811 RepID=A0ABY6KLQ5_9ARAC|nr:Burs [Cordylochernes scorpioides]
MIFAREIVRRPCLKCNARLAAKRDEILEKDDILSRNFSIQKTLGLRHPGVKKGVQTPAGDRHEQRLDINVPTGRLDLTDDLTEPVWLEFYYFVHLLYSVSKSSHDDNVTAAEVTAMWTVAVLLALLLPFAAPADRCILRPVIHVLQHPGCLPKPIPSFACQGSCSSYVQVSFVLVHVREISGLAPLITNPNPV